MIEGVGIDVVDIERFVQSLTRTPELGQRLFTESERSLSISSQAARKSLPWHDAEIVNLESGKPVFLFRGEIADLVDGASVHLSISHDAGIASAIVIVER
jgi:holo-[acyl-carrier protein] synthase